MSIEFGWYRNPDMMELYNLESTDKPEKIRQDTQNELANFKEFKEIMQKKDEVASKVNNLVSIIESVDMPEEVKNQLVWINIENVFKEDFYWLETNQEKLESLVIIDSFVTNMTNFVERIASWEEIWFFELKGLIDWFEEELDSLWDFIKIENGIVVGFIWVLLLTILPIIAALWIWWFVFWILAAAMEVTVLAPVISWVGLAAATTSIWTAYTLSNWVVEDRTEIYTKSLIFDKLDDTMLPENISKQDFEEMYDLVKSKVWERNESLRKLKVKIEDFHRKNIPHWLTDEMVTAVEQQKSISSTDWFTQELNAFYTQNQNLSETEKFKNFMIHLENTKFDI